MSKPVRCSSSAPTPVVPVVGERYVEPSIDQSISQSINITPHHLNQLCSPRSIAVRQRRHSQRGSIEKELTPKLIELASSPSSRPAAASFRMMMRDLSRVCTSDTSHAFVEIAACPSEPPPAAARPLIACRAPVRRCSECVPTNDASSGSCFDVGWKGDPLSKAPPRKSAPMLRVPAADLRMPTPTTPPHTQTHAQATPLPPNDAGDVIGRRGGGRRPPPPAELWVGRGLRSCGALFDPGRQQHPRQRGAPAPGAAAHRRPQGRRLHGAVAAARHAPVDQGPAA